MPFLTNVYPLELCSLIKNSNIISAFYFPPLLYVRCMLIAKTTAKPRHDRKVIPSESSFLPKPDCLPVYYHPADSSIPLETDCPTREDRFPQNPALSDKLSIRIPVRPNNRRKMPDHCKGSSQPD